MTYSFDGYNWLVVLEKGELLVENLQKIVKQEKIEAAWLSGLGGALWAELGFYDLDKQEYRWKKLDTLLEITSLQGNVAWPADKESDEPILHIHGTFSDETMHAYGGNVKELAVGGTCEILLHRWYDGNLKRKLDPKTGLKLLSK